MNFAYNNQKLKIKLYILTFTVLKGIILKYLIGMCLV